MNQSRQNFNIKMNEIEEFKLVKKKKVVDKDHKDITKQASKLLEEHRKKPKKKKKVLNDLNEKEKENLDIKYNKIFNELSKEEKKESKLNTYWIDEEEKEDKKEETKEEEYKDYNEMSDRLYLQLSQRKEKMDYNIENQIKVKQPEVTKINGKKTSFNNFRAICEFLNRKEDHVMKFLLFESSTTGSVNLSGALLIKGNYDTSDIENLLKKYLNEYVICYMCSNLKSKLEKDKKRRITYLICGNCKSERSVAALKEGYDSKKNKLN